MSTRVRSQKKQLVNGCIGKHRYETEAEAFQKGQLSYFCIFCSKWHRASVEPDKTTHAELVRNITELHGKLGQQEQTVADLRATVGCREQEIIELKRSAKTCPLRRLRRRVARIIERWTWR